MAPSHVLVPLDGSPLTDAALEEALGLFGCRVMVLNVVTPLDAGMTGGGVLEPGEERRERSRERADYLAEQSRQRAAEVDRTVETAVGTGGPTEAILADVDEHDIDRVVTGGHGGERGGSVRLRCPVASHLRGESSGWD